MGISTRITQNTQLIVRKYAWCILVDAESPTALLLVKNSNSV